MNNRLVKRESKDFLELTLKMYVDEVRLRLDKRVCLKCDICSLVCPREAVAIIPGEEDLEISIDPRVCLLCEVCAHFCPVGAVTLSYNGEPKTIFADHRGLAPFFPKIEMDKSRCVQPCPPLPEGEEHWCRRQLKLVANALEGCPKQCRKCLDGLPPPGHRPGRGRPDHGRSRTCVSGAPSAWRPASTRPSGSPPSSAAASVIDDRKCPPDCHRCIELCPVQAIEREGDRVFLKLESCSYCGVCVNICDYDAITCTREEVVAEPGEFSQAWEQAVAKLLEG